MIITAPVAFTFLITIPIIILLYLFKQKYEEHVVSSIYLWHELLKDIESTSSWKRFRKNLLMFLQILAMLLLIFAMAKPVLNFGKENAKAVVLVLDTSLSMQAEDYKPSRFEAAKKKAVEVISKLQRGTKISVMTLSSKIVIEESSSSDKNSLINKVNALQVTNNESDFKEGSVLLQSFIKQNPDCEVYLFGDKALNLSDLEINFFDFSKKGENFCITLLSHSVTQNGITALSRVANYTNGDANIPVSLYVDGKAYDAKNVEIKVNEATDVYWDAIPKDAKTLECRIDIKDSLAADNRMWDVINEQMENKVLLIGSKNVFIEKALRVAKNIKLFKMELDQKNILKGYDLYVFDGYMPESLPQDGSVIIFDPPKNKYFDVGGDLPVTSLKKTSHPLFNNINEITFGISQVKKIRLPAWGETVLGSPEGPVIIAGSLENRKLVVFGFDLHKSDIGLTTAFPILMTNCLDWLMPSNVKNVEAIISGQPVEFNLNPKAEQANAKIPTGGVTELAPPFPARIFEDTNEIGLYTLEQKLPDKPLIQYFAVNPPAESESNLQAVFEESRNDNANRNIKIVKSQTGIKLQDFILWVIISVLLLEWWVYRYEF